MTWGVVSVLKFLGLATKVKLPKQAQMDRMRFKEPQEPIPDPTPFAPA